MSEGFSSARLLAQDAELTVLHSWFLRAVAAWLDIALYRAMARIVRMVELDKLTRVDSLCQHSTSAVDLRTVLSQIRVFWQQLSWPDAETSYVFISRILDDVCKAIVFYVRCKPFELWLICGFYRRRRCAPRPVA